MSDPVLHLLPTAIVECPQYAVTLHCTWPADYAGAYANVQRQERALWDRGFRTLETLHEEWRDSSYTEVIVCEEEPPAELAAHAQKCHRAFMTATAVTWEDSLHLSGLADWALLCTASYFWRQHGREEEGRVALAAALEQLKQQCEGLATTKGRTRAIFMEAVETLAAARIGLDWRELQDVQDRLLDA